MTTYRELLARWNVLNGQIEAARVIERATAVAQIRELMEQYRLTRADLTGRRPANAASPTTKIPAVLAALYQDPKTGKTWSGRGRPPAWLGPDRERFRIAAQG
ncbi:H-NS histone family protein [Cupriavidus basilensis]